MWESTLFGRTGRSIRAWKAARSVAFSLSPRDPTRLRSNRGQKTQRSNGCVCARESTSLEGDRSPERSKLQSAEARRMVVWFKMTNFGKLGGREREREREGVSWTRGKKGGKRFPFGGNKSKSKNREPKRVISSSNMRRLQLWWVDQIVNDWSYFFYAFSCRHKDANQSNWHHKIPISDSDKSIYAINCLLK